MAVRSSLQNGHYRRILPVPACSGGGRLTGRTPAVQPRRRQRVKVPHTCHSRYPSGSAQLGRVGMWRGGGRLGMSVSAPHMGVIRSRGFVPSFSPFVSDPKSEPSVIRPGLPVLVSTSHTVAARRRSYQYPAYGRAGAQEDETNLSFGLSRPEGRGGRPLGSAGTDQSQ